LIGLLNAFATGYVLIFYFIMCFLETEIWQGVGLRGEIVPDCSRISYANQNMWWEMRRVTYVSGIERENDENGYNA
jgi:hypothetical protein